jgi:tetratricopeptide (TPR) repeat protein
LNPDNARLHYNLSLALSGLGDDEGQRKELERAVQLDSNLAPAYYHLAQLYIAHGSMAQAKQALRNALAIDPQFAAAQQALSSLQENSKRSE